MIQMEIDVHTSSFRTMRTYSNKRSRSPDAESPSDRPSKRISVAIGDDMSSTSTGYSHSDGAHSTNSSRFPSEDWVQQTGGLTIQSPLLPVGPDPYVMHENRGDEAMDEAMAVEPDEIERRATEASHLPLRRPSRTFIRVNTAPATEYPAHGAHYHETPFTPPSNITLQPPLYPTINIVPATPATPVRHQNPFGSMSKPSSPSSSSMTMCISPGQSYAHVPLSPTRRQRFTMGPRADCEKCRLGTKGHWMHID